MSINAEQNFCENFRKWVDRHYYRREKELAEKLGISSQQLNNIKHGRRVGNESWRRWAAEQLGLDYDELIGVTGPRSGSEEDQQDIIINVVDGSGETDLEKTANYHKSIPVYSSGRLTTNFYDHSFYVDEKPEDRILIGPSELKERSAHSLWALRVKDNTMSPSIPPGSIVIADLDDRDFSEGKIYVVRHPLSEDPPVAIVKRIYRIVHKSFQGFSLVSENPEHSPLITNIGWYDLVVGRALWVWRRVEL